MRYIGLLLFMLFIVPPILAEKIVLEWDTPECEDCVEGVRIYQAIRAPDPETGEPAHEFDYANPVAEIAAGTNRVEIDLSGHADRDTKYVFVARAFKGDDVSEDSNTESYVVSRVPPAAAGNLSGGYDDERKIISLSWEQAPDEHIWRTISHWIAYYRVDGGDWTPLGRINSDQELTLNAPFTAIAQGESKDVDFTIVTYRRSGVYSLNSGILTLTINRVEVPPIKNLRINIEVPVE